MQLLKHYFPNNLEEIKMCQNIIDIYWDMVIFYINDNDNGHDYNVYNGTFDKTKFLNY